MLVVKKAFLRNLVPAATLVLHGIFFFACFLKIIFLLQKCGIPSKSLRIMLANLPIFAHKFASAGGPS